jgi:hypothetical protein
VGLLQEALPGSTLVVAIDPGKVNNRVWLSTGEAGEVVPPRSLPVLRPGLEELHRLVLDHTGPAGPVFAIEATGGLHQAWMRELNQRFPGSVRLFAPSETSAARAQLGSRRFKTDDRDCAALTYLARQGQGRPVPDQVHDALAAAVRHRRVLIGEHKVGDHVERLVQVAVGGGDGQAGVCGQGAHVQTVAQPAQRQHDLGVHRADPLRRTGPRPTAVPGDPAGHRLQHRCGHIQAGTMRHSGLPGKRRSVFGESIFTPRARALFLNPGFDQRRRQSSRPSW